MKKMISIWILFTLLAASLAACQPGAKRTTIGEQDAGRTITLDRGDTLVVELEGNPSTGYSWIAAPQDPPLLKQVGELQVTPQSALVGAPGVLVLKFEAVSKGQALLHLEYRRPWETSAQPEKTFEVTVVVN